MTAAEIRACSQLRRALVQAIRRYAPSHRSAAWAGLMAFQAQEASLYLWERSLSDAASRGCHSFVGTPLLADDLRHLPALWMWNSVVRLPTAVEAQMRLPPRPRLLGIQLAIAGRYEERKGLVELDWVGSEDGLTRDLTLFRREPQWVGEPLREEYAPIVALLRFIQQPFCVLHKAHPDPPGEPPGRAARPRHESDLRVVTLRRTEHRYDQKGEPRDWSCHWVTRMTWRRRAECWHRGVGPIYVRSHLKGDLTQPFKPPREVVHTVVR